MTSDQQQPTRRAWLPWAVAAAAAVTLAAALIVPRLTDNADAEPAAAATSAPARPKTFTAQGSITLGLGDFAWDEIGSIGQPGPICFGEGGFDDIATGASVTITDAAGEVVAVGELNSSYPGDFSEAQTPTSCKLRFSITGVPTGKGFYGVEVTHRGAVKYAEADMTKPLELTLG